MTATNWNQQAGLQMPKCIKHARDEEVLALTELLFKKNI
jgi:hypothetical protein